MKLTRINPMSSLVFGLFATIFTAIIGLLLVIGRQFAYNAEVDFSEYFSYFGYSYGESAGYILVQAPIIAGFVMFITVFIAIAIYNLVAKKFPISWEVKK